MGSDKTKFEGSMLDACESDADLIITGLWDMKEITEKVAQEFPEKKFIIFDTDVDYTLGDLKQRILHELQSRTRAHSLQAFLQQVRQSLIWNTQTRTTSSVL